MTHAADFAGVTTWIFDLDNTLYPPEMELFSQIQKRMTAYVMRLIGTDEATADHLRGEWWRVHGTTLAGLMAEHQIDPHDYLADVHDIDFSVLSPDPALAAAIEALPGRKIVHTNADAAYACKVLEHRGLGMFEAVCGIEEAGFHPKPDPRAYAPILAAHAIEPQTAAFFEDDPRNLLHPHSLGMRTVLVGRGWHGTAMPSRPGEAAPHVAHHTHDLTAFLQSLAGDSPRMADCAQDISRQSEG